MVRTGGFQVTNWIFIYGTGSFDKLALKRLSSKFFLQIQMEYIQLDVMELVDITG